MSCGNISTGFFRGSTRVANDSTPMFTPGRTVLFSSNSPMDMIYSPTFTVEPGLAVLIETYNMPDAFPIYVNRLVRASFAPPTATPCPPCNMEALPGPEGTIMNRERMTLGDGDKWWRLYKNSAGDDSVLQLMIMVPGLYELELSDRDMLGDLQVEYITWNLSLTPYMPSVYYAGKANIYGV